MALEMDLLDLPAVSTSSGSVIAYSLSSLPSQSGKPVTSLADVDAEFRKGAGGTAEEDLATDMAAAVKRPFSGLTPRSMAQVGSGRHPSGIGIPASSLSSAVASLQVLVRSILPP